jgi:hypothetical protein
MAAIEWRPRKMPMRWLGALLGALLTAASCQTPSSSDPSGGETHFLRRCAEGSSVCGAELDCLSGVCSLECDDDAACSAYPGAECLTPAGSPSYCDVSCSVDADCAGVSPAHRCALGACRTGESACTSGTVGANQVVVLGDSFFAVSHEITAFLEEQARAAGALSPGERYRDNSSLLDNALEGDGILQQYEEALAEAPVEVVIMNGGGADMLVRSCEPIEPECGAIVDATAAATDLFARMAEGGVAHVLYVFYPDPVEAELREKVDLLRPQIEALCADSPVPCHFLDLRPTFSGRYDEYILSDGMNPTTAGSEAAAGAIWAAMQQYCLAQ